MRLKYLFFLSFLFLSNALFSQAERIINFDVEVVVNLDRSVNVKESITVYAAGNMIKRGITRNFPARRDMKGRSIKMKYDIQQVKKNNIVEPYHVVDGENRFTIYIGERDVFLEPAEYRYDIEYTVPNQVGFFDEYDEIYWNAIGTDVEFLIENASCKVRLPEGAAIIQQAAYTGYFGQAGSDFIMDDTGYFLDYKATRVLKPGEGFTVAIGFEKGFVDQPSILQRFGTLIVILLGLFFFDPLLYLYLDAIWAGSTYSGFLSYL